MIKGSEEVESQKAGHDHYSLMHHVDSCFVGILL